jgi:hypothetical protein
MCSFTPSACRLTVVPFLAFLCSLFVALPHTVSANEVSCQFKAATDTTEIHVLANGKTLWTGPIEKQQTKTVSIPEGPFTVISKVYNENLKTKEDVRTETHTRQCRDNAVFSVPLFQDPNKG